MEIKVDLTREKFDDYHSVNFYDSKTIFFDPANFLPQIVSFKVWGAGLMPGFPWSNYMDLDTDRRLKSIIDKTKGNEVAIQGFALLTFEEVVAGQISISPYYKRDLLKDKNGGKIEFKREWTLDAVDKSCYEYIIDASIYFPYGGCELKLYTKGTVAFEFDTNDCVYYLDYISNPNIKETFWGYLKDKSFGTNSYEYEDPDSIT